MKAVVCDRYGPPEVLRLDDVPRPVPRPDEVLIKIRATAVNRSDTETRAGTPPAARLVTGLRRPRHRILGSELAGVVEAAGPAVTEFTVGDEVFGVKAWTFGAHAEYVCMRQNAALAHKPAEVGFEEAAAVCDGVILALMGLRRAEVGKGRSILVYGASGSIGTAAVQLSRYFGADVTAVCGTKNLELRSGRWAPTRSSTTPGKTSRRTARPTTSSSTRSASTRSGAAGVRSTRAGSTWPPTICATCSWPSGLGSGTRR